MKEILKAFVLIAAQMSVVVRVPSDHDLTKADAFQALVNKVAKITHYRFMDGDENERYWRTMDGQKAQRVAWIDFEITPKGAVEGVNRIPFGSAVLAYFDNGLKASIAEHMGIKVSTKGAGLTGTVYHNGQDVTILINDKGGLFIPENKVCYNNAEHIIAGQIRVYPKRDESGYTKQAFLPIDKDAHPHKKGSEKYICGACERNAQALIQLRNTPQKKGKGQVVKIRNITGKTNNEKFDMYELKLTQLEAYASRLEADKDALIHTIEGKDAEIGQRIWTISQLDEQVDTLTKQLDLACANVMVTHEAQDTSAHDLVKEFEKVLEAKAANPRTHITSVGQMYRDLQWMKEQIK